jgi:hypothetical protein
MTEKRWRAEMSRYREDRGAEEFGACEFPSQMFPAPHGEWVRFSDAETVIDRLAARVAELESHRLSVAIVTGCCYEGDGMPPTAAPDENVIGEIERVKRYASEAFDLRAERDTLRARLAELTEWRPMSEAPMDGTEVLLRVYGAPVSTTIGEWDEVNWWTHIGALDDGDPSDGEHCVCGWLPLPEVT